jgi:hypothetical protein
MVTPKGFGRMEQQDEPAAPRPDDKDWTWVLLRSCPECGFDATEVDGGTVADRILGTTPRWRAALTAHDVGQRPAPQVWSILEYGAHVRDVHSLFGRRAQLMLTQDDPEFENWDQDETALTRRYWLADPAAVADELDAAATVAAGVFQAAGADDWQRTGRRSNGSVFTLETLGRYYLHDVEHHLHDVGY